MSSGISLELQVLTERSICGSFSAIRLYIKGVSFDNPVAGDFYRKYFGDDMPYYMLVDSPTMITNSMPIGGWCMIAPEFH